MEAQARQQMVDALMQQSPPQAKRLGIPSGISQFLDSLSMIPTAEQEALQEPFIAPETYGLGTVAKKAATAAPGLFMLGQTVFHGSPHKFDKFDMSKIGTGEGAQAYGHGLYFAESPQVAKSYADTLASMRASAATRQLQDFGGDIDKAIASVRAQIENLTALPNKGGDPERWARQLAIKEEKIAELNSLKAGQGMSKPNLYHVDLPDEQISKMLDWDKPLSQQPEAVRQAVKNHMDLKGVKSYRTPDGEVVYLDVGSESGLRGQDIYRMIGAGADAKTASETLKWLGVPGIQYLDGMSRTAKEGTRNFVVFDDTIPKIVKRD